MITVISGTDRPDSKTLKIARFYHATLIEKGLNSHLLSLETLDSHKKNETFLEIESKILIPSSKFLMITPEYNGSFPGIFKLLVDLADVKKAWWHKKAALVGVADGRAGNLRGMDHLTGVLHHVKVNVMPNKLPISTVHKLLNEQGELADEATKKVIMNQIDEFIAF
jgi:chromate reductase, NAD(P)H dehydrogenase (quinone)